MGAGGLSRARLGRLHDVMAGHVERGAVPGVVTLVCRRGEINVDAIGVKTIGGEPIGRDTIFRIASMTKPVVAAAAMILVEECRLRLAEPVDRLLPELADRRVLRRLDGSLEDTVPAARSITVRDLLTFCMGFGLIMAPPEAYPIQRAVAERELMTLGPPRPASPLSADEWMRRFGALPLMDQPGERWRYNTGSHVLGVLVARAAEQPLEALLRTRIFEPLGMKDTGFSVEAPKLHRLAGCYQTDADTGRLVLHDGVADSQWSRPTAFPDAAGGLVSTIDDYLAFGRMMLDKGAVGRERVLSRLSVEAMTTDQLTAEQKAGADFFLGPGRGWGFGLSVVTRRDDIAAVPGRYGWDGGYGTSWSSDPAEQLVGILMTQRLWDSPSPPSVYLDFWTGACQAIDD